MGSFIVPDRAYLEVAGKDAVKIVHSVSTNDITDLSRHGDCIATAFLTPKGRILADAIVYNTTPASEGPAVTRLLIETHKAVSPQLMKFLVMYRLRSVATIKAVEYETKILTGSDQAKADPSALVSKDPRGSELGSRSLVPLAGGKNGESFQDIDRSMYMRYRMLHGIAEGPEIVNKIPLECNLDMLNYISFSKGCYVGQELVARTKHKGVVRKRILPFLRSLTTTEGAEETIPFAVLDSKLAGAIASSTVIDVPPVGNTRYVVKGDTLVGQDSDSGVVLATTRGQELGLALLRLDSVLPADKEENDGTGKTDAQQADSARGNARLIVKRGEADDVKSVDGAAVRVFRPPWWPDADPVTGRSMLTA